MPALPLGTPQGLRKLQQTRLRKQQTHGPRGIHQRVIPAPFLEPLPRFCQLLANIARKKSNVNAQGLCELQQTRLRKQTHGLQGILQRPFEGYPCPVLGAVSPFLSTLGEKCLFKNVDAQGRCKVQQTRLRKQQTHGPRGIHPAVELFLPIVGNFLARITRVFRKKMKC